MCPTRLGSELQFDVSISRLTCGYCFRLFCRFFWEPFIAVEAVAGPEEEAAVVAAGHREVEAVGVGEPSSSKRSAVEVTVAAAVVVEVRSRLPTQ